MKNMNVFTCFALASCIGVCADASAETYYELGAGLLRYSINVGPRSGVKLDDDASAWNVSAGAYRQLSQKSWWGTVIEYSGAIGREEDLAGTGNIIGIRPIDYVFAMTPKLLLEGYAGIAQYQYKEAANGYYVGSVAKYRFTDHMSVAADLRYYKDLAYDAPLDDDFVRGVGLGVKLFYRF